MTELTLPARPERADALCHQVDAAGERYTVEAFLFLDTRDGGVHTGCTRVLHQVTTGLHDQVWIWRLPDRVDAWALDSDLRENEELQEALRMLLEHPPAPGVSAWIEGFVRDVPTLPEEAACSTS